MEIKYAVIGFALGAVLGWMRVKSSPTPMTPGAKGF